ncbi:MAG: excalibur calcium-binding domain-containing protein [Proteobacteria bacterium]|nr:excalibur calcium-binding domain-containing protein [Pseudomonadota bacterium]
MTSCAEATFYLKTCGVSSLDGNNDGIACNALCK